MDKNWKKQKEPLKQISGNAGSVESLQENVNAPEDIPEHLVQNLTIDERSQSRDQDDRKSGKSRRMEVKGETTQTQTGKLIQPVRLLRTT
jgi:checkpoint serine/threonine-protein kinase